MKISLDWLSDHIAFAEKDPQRIAEVLTQKVAEIEKIISPQELYKTVITGKLLQVTKVEGSEKLHQGIFDLGAHGEKSIIFGKVFPLSEGEIVPIGLAGTELPTGIVIKNTKLLGVPTEGMVCADAELGFHFTGEGLLRFPEDTPLGLPILEVLEKAYQNVVIGEILDIQKHPNADNLSLTKIRVSESEILEIVCGGSNLKLQAKVPVSLVGANLWGKIAIKKTKIRDVESNGMICSTEELRFAPSQNKEIYLLPEGAPVGQPFFSYVLGGDSVFEIENPVLTNRPDLFSHIGFARECFACDLGALKPEKAPSKITETKDLPVEITIPKDPKICQRYMAVAVNGVDGKTPSPLWMQQRLAACGIRAISALVDVTNYVMLEYGVPMHAFDLARVGKKWTMRLAKEGEKMVTLDEVERTLTTETIIFENEKTGIFDLCGIMGGASSGVQESTKDILLHAMSYDPVKIRRAALKVGPRSDAAAIFEKNVPPAMVEPALQRALTLILEIFPEAKVVSKVMDQQNRAEKIVPIELPHALVTRIAACDILLEKIQEILEKLGCTVVAKKEVLTVTPPAWRVKDLQIPEDLVEEVMRIYGLSQIPESAPTLPMLSFTPSPERVLEKKIAQILVKNGCYEILTFAFLGSELLARAGLEKNSPSYIHLENPLSEDLSIMRSSLTPRLLETAEKNVRERAHFRIFESGKVYRWEENEKIEEHRITALFVGDDFLGVKSLAEEIIAAGGWFGRLEPWENPMPFVHPSRNALYKIGANGRIKIYELHPRTSAAFGLPTNSSMLCLTLAHLAELPAKIAKIKPLPKYQEIPFDFSVLAPRKTLVADLVKGLEKLDDRIAHIAVMEVWEGKGVPEGEKSVTISAEFRAPDRTLTETERDELFQLIIRELEKRGAKRRFEGKQ